MIAESEKIKKYYEGLNKKIEAEYKIADKVKKIGIDPEDKSGIPIARDMNERVEGLISAVAPQIVNSGVIDRIRELEKEYGTLDWRVALVIAKEIAEQKFCKFKDKQEAIEIGIRTGFAYATLGIVAAPLEGFIGIEIKKRKDGKEYLAFRYAGPIRGAGGTGASVSVIIGDYVRKQLGYEPYDPTEDEINRAVTECYDYHTRVTNLQYLPSEKELFYLVSKLPVEIDGDPTEEREVSNYKDLSRIQTNRIRGGVCLVLAEGISQKAPKVWKRIEKWGKEMGMDWEFLEEFLQIQKKMKAKKTEETKKEEVKGKTKKEEKLTPNYTFIADLVAGRPILAYPMKQGGFRLRYGRTRTTGYSSSAVHPATLEVLEDFIAVGTQLKIERPGKATTINIIDSIEGPIVKLNDESVLQLNSLQKAKEIKKEVKEILFLGDILINYGDFSENNHKLVPAGYCEEWWVQELEKKIVDLMGTLDEEKISEITGIEPDRISNLLKNFFFEKPTPKEAIILAKTFGISLHPTYIAHFNCLKTSEFLDLINWLDNGKSVFDEDTKTINKLILPFKPEESKKTKRLLELIGLPHKFSVENIVLDKDTAQIFSYLFNFDNLKSNSNYLQQKIKDIEKNIEELNNQEEQITNVELINKHFDKNLRDKSGTFIGARMGRPEKAKMRKLTGSPHGLFPIAEQGGRLRCFQSALECGYVEADFPLFYCETCKKNTILPVCETCGTKTKQKYNCLRCGDVESDTCVHGKTRKHKIQKIDFNKLFEETVKGLGMKTYPDLIKGVRGTTNRDKIPEHIGKAILRAKHEIYVNKDGTTRFDMTELPITHFKPSEIKTSIEKLKELGYEKDIEGKELISDNQILEIFPQDIILPGNENHVERSAEWVLLHVAQFIDEMLVRLYKSKPYYEAKTSEDLVGQVVIGLAPHISSGLVGRIIGFSNTQGLYAHPMFHAGLRRDCDGDEACVLLLMDGLLNFSRQYLPDKRGARTMDAPLVLTTRIIPYEVDDMVLGIDKVWKYPLELYEKALEYVPTSEVKVKQLNNVIRTPEQYEGFGYTHPTSDINKGVIMSAYKTLPSMAEKLEGQMKIAEKIRAVDTAGVAGLVIDKHFIRDIKGNLRKFSQQQFRCVKCNVKYRRPPLVGKCTKCGGKIIFTISEGSIIKYLEPTLKLAENYAIDPYLKQSIELLKDRIEEVFGRETEKQKGLNNWFS